MNAILSRIKVIIITIFLLYILILSNFIQPLDPNNKTKLEPLNHLRLGSELSDEKEMPVNSGMDVLENSNIKPLSNSRGRHLKNIISLDDPTVQLTVISGDAYDNSYGSNIRSGSSIATGDIDNDGFEDLLLGCPFADGTLENRGNTGQVLVFFGGAQTHPNTIYDQADYNVGEIDIVIDGADNNDLLGGSVACGDIDGDSYDDIVICAPFGDSESNTRNDAGEIYVIYGAARDTWEPLIDLRNTAPDLLILGARAGDRTGFSVALGDVLGDSKLDIIIGAKLADPERRNNAGMAFAIAGNTRSNLGKTIDLLDLVTSGRGSNPYSESHSRTRSRATQLVEIDGVSPDDRAGFAVAAGDVNGDGREDIIIGARHAQYNGSFDNSGVTDVVYGRRAFSSKINLTQDADIYVYAPNANDNSGWSLVSGNINGDSYDDIIIGSPYADGPNNAQRDCGEVYVIYGSGALSKNYYLFQSPPDIIIYGVDAWDNFGFSLAVGSMNDDQYDDYLMGARGGNGEFNDIGDCGDSYLLLGNSTSSLGDTIDLITKSRTIFFGIDVGDNSGRFLHFGDLDGDHYEDIIIGAPYADGPKNARDSSGEFYLIYIKPPPLSNSFFKLLDSDSQNNKTIFSRYREYTFRVNVTNILGYHDCKSITLFIDPEGYNISFGWFSAENEITRISDPLELVECVSITTDAKHDSFYNYSIDFKLIFNWNFSVNYPVDCRITTEGILSYSDSDTYYDVFEVNNDLNFIGDLKLTSARRGNIKPDAWVAGTEQITFGGLMVVYNNTIDYFPPASEYTLGIQDNSQTWQLSSPAPGSKISASITTPAETGEYYYHLMFLDIPPGGDKSDINISLKIDNDKPSPPSAISIKAKSQSDPESAIVDNDEEIFISWIPSEDIGSGIKGYYYSFSNHGGTAIGDWTTENTAELKNATEGKNNVYVWAEDDVGNIGFANSSQIYIDLTEVTFENFTPVSDTWFTSKNINCSIQIFDRGGFGVNPDNITYIDMQTKKWLPVNIDALDNQTGSFINISALAELGEGKDSYIQFRATDLAGNGPTESEQYFFKIDTTPVQFHNVKPDPLEKQTKPKVRCYITLEDRGGSGVDIGTIQYSYTKSGVENFTRWSNTGLAIVANNTPPEISSTWFIDLTFSRGSDNFIRWRAKDIAGNGFTFSENYSVLVNALPDIVISGVEPNGVYKTFDDLEFNANGTTDADDILKDKNFIWHSNITGDIGTGKVIVTSLPVGRHLITLSVSDGQNYATNRFNITVFSPPKPKEEEDKGMFGISKNADSIIMLLILLIIIILILFFIVYSREKRIRKRLEEKTLGLGPAATMSRYRTLDRAPGGEITQLTAASAASGPKVMTPGAEGEQISLIGSPFGAPSVKPKIQSLPTIGGTTSTAKGTGGVPEPTLVTKPTVAPGTVGRNLPQLPPARIRGYPSVQRKPDLKLEIDTHKKMELLEKKMLVGEIPVELYNKLSKKYEEELKLEAEQAEEKAKDETGEPEPESTPKPIPDVVVTPENQKQLPVRGPKLGLTPEVQAQKLEQKLEQEEEPKREVEHAQEPEQVKDRDQVQPKKRKQPKIKQKVRPTLETAKSPQEQTIEPESKEDRETEIRDQKDGFETAPGFSSDELEFLKKLRKDKKKSS